MINLTKKSDPINQRITAYVGIMFMYYIYRPIKENFESPLIFALYIAFMFTALFFIISALYMILPPVITFLLSIRWI